MKTLGLVAMLLVVGAPSARAGDCEDVRKVRQLARAAQLDDRTLAALETRHCGNQGASAVQQCNDLTVMMSLARAGGIANRELRMIERERNARCEAAAQGAGNSVPRWSWSNGKAAFERGEWSYPTGAVARHREGRWDYPNGATARRGGGGWKYPDGARATTRDGIWSDPQGAKTFPNALIKWVCRGDRTACSNLRRDYDAAQGDARDAILIAAVWAHHSAGGSTPAPAPAPPPQKPDQRQACVEWAYAQYSKSWSSADARTHANKRCATIGDLEIAKLLYSYYSKSWSFADATTHALANATTDLTAKRDILEFAMAAYSKTWSASDAAQHAVKRAKTIAAGSLACLQGEYAAYVNSWSSADAMNKAFEVCRAR